MTLPKRPTSHRRGDRAVALARLALPEPWIVREQGADYGIDLEVELASDEVTGRLFKCQVKGHKRIAWTASGTHLERVKPSTAQYWQVLRVPVVLLLVDLERETVYWAEADSRETSANSNVLVSREKLLPRSSHELERHVIDWIDNDIYRRVVWGVPLLAKRLKGRLEACGYDSFLPLSSEEIEETRDVYESLALLARAVGLNSASMIPWSLWTARSRKLWGDIEDLCWGTHDEIAHYIKAIYERALPKVIEILDTQSPTPENAAAKSFVSQQGDRTGVTYRCNVDLEAINDEMWKNMEKELCRAGALGFTVSPGSTKKLL